MWSGQVSLQQQYSYRSNQEQQQRQILWPAARLSFAASSSFSSSPPPSLLSVIFGFSEFEMRIEDDLVHGVLGLWLFLSVY